MDSPNDYIENGYFLAARKLFKSEIWDKPAIWLKIWIYLIGNVNWNDTSKINKGSGKFTYKQIMIETGANYNQVKATLDWLKKKESLMKVQGKLDTTITLCKYDKYQDPDQYKKESSMKAERKLKESSMKAGKKERKYQRKKEDIKTLNKKKILLCKFDQFWTRYPKKKAKKDALRAWEKIKFSDDLFEMIMKGLDEAIECEEWNKDKGQFIPLPATWLNGRRWGDKYDIMIKKKPFGQNFINGDNNG